RCSARTGRQPAAFWWATCSASPAGTKSWDAESAACICGSGSPGPACGGRRAIRTTGKYGEGNQPRSSPEGFTGTRTAAGRACREDGSIDRGQGQRLLCSTHHVSEDLG